MPTLNIKDPAVYELAAVLAERWSTTKTGAVRRALEDAVTLGGPAVRRQRAQAALAGIGRHIKPGWTAESEDRELYDPAGLPL
ncbi:MAG: type II toxin-antitoxin system VapB family antitoxin [Bifidobacteriaceae bacterium]|nr:type II toxin-antitoxin system VapB family antitoxin [Bifidobacteriaceae bacterium]